jgi:hypothetical protein
MISASGQSRSSNECLEDEGATVIEECFGMYMNLCNKIEIEPNSNCNIRVFDNTQINWLSN